MKEKIQSLRQLHAESTQGEWEARGSSGLTPQLREIVSFDGKMKLTSGTMYTNDAEFIAEAHNTLPQLLEALETMYEALEDSVELIESEYCSHEIGAPLKQCYAQKQRQALDTVSSLFECNALN